jgi:hypothetical protein
MRLIIRRPARVFISPSWLPAAAPPGQGRRHALPCTFEL